MKKMALDEEEGEESMDTGVKYFRGNRKTERDIELEQGDDYVLDLNKKFDLANEEEKYDIIPEIWNGRNIADFVDPDIMAKLDALEKEEELRERAGVYDEEPDSDDENMAEIRELASKIRVKKKLMKNDRRIDRTNKPTLTRRAEPKVRERSVSRLKREFTELGVDMTGTEDTHFATQKAKKRRSRSTSVGGGAAVKKPRDSSTTPRDKSGVRDSEQGKKLRKVQKKVQKNVFAKEGKSGESDRHIKVKRPKHLFAGKRGIGKTSRR